MSNASGKIAGIFPLTPLQKGMLTLAVDAGGNDPYVIQTWGALTGLPDVARLESAWHTLVQRHAALRSAFVFQGQQEPRQVVLREAAAPVWVEDCRSLGAAALQLRLDTYRADDLQQGFVLTRPALARLALFQTGDAAWRFVLTHHHLILDGWSVSVLFGELQALLAGSELGATPAGPEVLAARIASAAQAHTDPFWREMLAPWTPTQLQAEGSPGTAALDSLDSLDASGASRLRETLPPASVTRLRETARRLAVTPAALTAAAWLLALCRASGQRSVATGVTTSGRADDAASQGAVGMFVNTLPLCLALNTGETLDNFVQRVARLWRGVVERDQTDVAQLRALTAAAPGQPLFDSLLAFENFPQAETDPEGVQLEAHGSLERTNLGAALVVIPGPQQWRLELQIEHARCPPAQANHLLGLLREAVDLLALPGHTVLDDAWARLGEGLSVRAQRPSLLPATTPPNLISWWAAGVLAAPEAVATRDGARSLTRQQIDHLSRRCAWALSALGVRAGDRVAIHMERSDSLLAVMLGVVRTGACYVPIDPHQGPARRAQVLADSEPVLVLSDAALAQPGDVVADALLHGAAEPEQAWQDPAIHPLTPAYIIYTSGSTGTPKGVVVSHHNVVQLIAACGQRMDLGARDVWSFFHSFAFDFSVWEIWGAWLTGGSVLVVPYTVSRDPLQFVQLCDDAGVTVLSQTPSAFKGFEQAEAMRGRRLPSLRHIVFGGEAVILGSLHGWIQRYGDQQPALINMYGITETTVHVTFQPLDAATILHAVVAPIGGPLPHLGLRLEQASGLASLIDQPGELVVGGQGVALGYFKQPRLTAQRFVPDPQAVTPGQRAYRSGDLGVRGADGQWRPQGRADRQVKVRGFRIELGEIENALSQLAAVATCAVYALPKPTAAAHAGDLGLCAWVVLREGASADMVALRHALTALLPPHMVPERLLRIAAIPLTGSGKLDTTRLPDPWQTEAGPTEAANDAPAALDPATQALIQTLTQALCEVWQEALGCAVVRPFDTFFAVGGDSVRSLKVTSLSRARGIQFPLGKLLENPTPASLAHWVHAQSASATPAGNPHTAATEAATSAAPALPAAFELVEPGLRPALPAGLSDAWPATRLQLGMLFHAGYGDDRKLYEDLFSYRLELHTTPERLSTALAQLHANHPVLRSRFLQVGEQLLQVVPAACEPALQTHDLRALEPEVRELRLQALGAALAARSIDPFTPPLFELLACQLGEREWSIALLCHHAILDGWSIALLTTELFDLCRLDAATKSTPDSTEPARTDTAAQALHAHAESQAIQDGALRERWAQRVGSHELSHLWRWPGAAATLPEQGLAQLRVAPGTLQRLRTHASAAGVHIKHYLLGIYGAVGAWAQGTPQVPVGVVMNGRPDIEGADRAVGMFLNTLPVALSAHGSWLALAQAAAQAEREVYADRALPLAELQRMVGGPTFELSFNFVHFHSREAMVRGGIAAAEQAREANSLPISATFAVSPDGETLNAQIQHGTPMSEAQLHWLCRRLEEALAQAAADPLAQARLCDPLAPWPPVAVPPVDLATTEHQAVHDTVLQRLRAQPGAVVLIDTDGVPLLAEELLELHGRFVAHLQRSAGVLLGRPCALYLRRSPELVAAMLAVASCGGWTVYLDSSAPAARQTAILASLHKPVLLHHSDLGTAPMAGTIPDAHAVTSIDLADAPFEAAAHQPLPIVPLLASAYCIFTSGSTGVPKGVSIAHGALAAHMAWFNRAFGIGPGDRVLYRTQPGFDASVWEFWAPLMTGAMLVMAPDDALGDPALIAESVVRHRITALQLVPTLLDAMADPATLSALRGLRWLFLGGEALKRELALQVMAALPALRLVNLYGPTETTIQVCSDTADATLDGGGATWPIGRPTDATHAVVVDEQWRPLPTGALGELLIGGAQVGQGYLDLPRQTAGRFVPDPFGAAGARAFLTGDRVRRLPDGRLSFLGRSDDQIKIAGNRIELGEIEALLAPALPGRRSAAGVLSQDGTEQLVAYLEAPSGKDDIDHTVRVARAHLDSRVPRYMLPSRWLPVAQWPQLSSGKTDRKALLLIGLAHLADTGELAKAPPDSATAAPARTAAGPSLTSAASPTPDAGPTALLQRLLGALLGKAVAADDDFFDLGGDSIVAMQLVARLRGAGWVVSPRQIFEQRRVAAIGAQLTALVATRATLPEPAHGDLQPLPAQAWFARLPLRQRGWWNQAVGLRLLHPVDAAKLHAHLDTLAQRHRVLGLRLSPQGAWGEGDARALVEHWPVANLAPARLAELRRERMAALQASFNLASGPIWGALLETDATGQVSQASIAIHHLAVDGYSWRLLFTQLNQLLASQPLEPAGPSALAVAAAMARAGTRADLPSPNHDAALAHWREHGRQSSALYGSVPRATGPESATLTRRFVLPAAASAALLGRCERDWRTAAEALVGGVLLHALGQLAGRETCDIAIEHHGRDAVGLGELGVERTLGWFTSLHPLLATPQAELAASIRAFKQAHQRAVTQPIDWLRACMLDAGLVAAPSAAVVLNYLGSFDSSFGADSHLVPADDDLGPSIGPDNPRTSALDVVALVESGQMRVSLSADGLGRWASQIDALTQILQDKLLQLADVGRAPPASALWLPQDFVAPLDDASLQGLLARWPQLQDILPLTPTQHGMLFTHQRHGGADGTHIQQVEFQVSRELDVDGVRQAFDALVLRHETLRTVLTTTTAGEPVQVVLAQAQMPLTVVDFSDAPDPGARWQHFVAQDARQGLDPDSAPMSRVTVVRLGPAALRVLWTHHHLVLDGWSLPLLLQELAQPPEALARLASPVSRQPFWPWLREHQAAPARARQRALWQQRFEGFCAPDRIQSVTRPDATPDTAEGAIEFTLPPPAWGALKQQAQAAGVTASTLAQAAWGLLLSRLLRTRDLAIGVTVSGRPPELSGADLWVGMFINTLPLRVKVQPAMPARDWLQGLQAQALVLQAHSQDALADIPRWTGVDHLIETLVVCLNYPVAAPAANGSTMAVADRVVAREKNEYPLSLYAIDTDRLELTLRYDPQVVDRAMAAVLAEGVTQILQAWSHDLSQPLGAAHVMSAKRRQQLLERGTSTDRVDAPCLLQRLATHAEQRGDAVALAWGDGQHMSYRELQQRSQRLAARLQAQYGCGSETLVAIAGHREPETVVAMLAVLWCGAAFVPLDPEQPPQRLGWVCEDARPSLLLARPETLLRLAPLGLPSLALDMGNTDAAAYADADADAMPSLAPRQPLGLAYMLFTSGSTGRPKGVAVGWEALNNAIVSMTQRPLVEAHDTLASVTTISFDISLLEILGPLTAGARLCLVDPDTARDGRALQRLIERERVTVLQATPATWKLLREAGLHAPQLRSWCGGEALKPDLAAWLRSATAQTWNLYGPTETTIWSSVGQLDDAAVHVGQAIAHTTLCLVNDDLSLALDGAVGEVAIGGAGVSRGYAGQAGRTAAQFVPAADGSGTRMYLTGDLGRWGPDGRLEILGRVDRQIKVQGFRIEPGDIEQALLADPQVRDAVAAVVPGAALGQDAESVLLAWVRVDEGASPDLVALRERLQQQLPAYMVPAQLIAVSSLPLTANRKVDVAALPLPMTLTQTLKPKPESAAPNATSAPEAAGTTPYPDALTQVLALLMARVLSLERAPAAHDDFFSLGGQSLMAMQLRSLLERFAATEVDLKLIFDLRTPAALAHGLCQLPGASGLEQRAQDSLQNLADSTAHRT